MKSGRPGWRAIAKLYNEITKGFSHQGDAYDLIKGSKLKPAPLMASSGLLNGSITLHAI